MCSKTADNVTDPGNIGTIILLEKDDAAAMPKKGILPFATDGEKLKHEPEFRGNI